MCCLLKKSNFKSPTPHTLISWFTMITYQSIQVISVPLLFNTIQANHGTHWTVEREKRKQNDETEAWQPLSGNLQPAPFNKPYTFFCDAESDTTEVCPTQGEMEASGDFSKWFCSWGEFGYSEIRLTHE